MARFLTVANAGFATAAMSFVLAAAFSTGSPRANLVAADDLPADQLQASIEIIQNVSSEGAGHQAAAKAVAELQQAGPEALMPLLDGMEKANPLALNWLRNAFETVAAKAEANDQLPLAKFRSFLDDRSHRATSRHLVFEWIRRADPEVAKSLVPTFLDDPSEELRREAVAQLVERADKAEGEAKKDLFQQALTGATDDDQVRKIVKGLEEFEVDVDLQSHYGFVTEWQLLGPFDNKDEGGFDVAYPPEEQVNLQASYEGQLDEVTWQQAETEDDYGLVDLNAEVAHHKGAIQYAFTEVESDTEQPVEFRLATPNAWKLWLNGELLFEREEYHRGTFFDQYRIPAKLNAGKNRILLKVCQNEQKDSWAQVWQYQFRVCDPNGMALSRPEK